MPWSFFASCPPSRCCLGTEASYVNQNCSCGLHMAKRTLAPMECLGLSVRHAHPTNASWWLLPLSKKSTCWYNETSTWHHNPATPSLWKGHAHAHKQFFLPRGYLFQVKMIPVFQGKCFLGQRGTQITMQECKEDNPLRKGNHQDSSSSLHWPLSCHMLTSASDEPHCRAELQFYYYLYNKKTSSCTTPKPMQRQREGASERGKSGLLLQGPL